MFLSLAHLACFPSFSETVAENQQECLLLGKGKDLKNFEASSANGSVMNYSFIIPNDVYSCHRSTVCTVLRTTIRLHVEVVLESRVSFP